MIDRLLPHFERELEALRSLAGAFADAHPAAAGRLRLSRGTVDDPHVERLLEGAAFLTARVQQRLDDEFPEITDALINVLYPHYLAPMPPCSVVRFAARPDLRASYVVPAATEIRTDPIGGEPCRFRTTQDVPLWPLAIDSVRLSGLPLAAPANPLAARARSVLRIVLRLTEPTLRFADLDLASLRFFLTGSVGSGTRLYELLCGHALGVALADGVNDDRPTLLPPGAIAPAGFDASEALLPWPARSFAGFRLLSEYFALPEKFLFVDLGGLEARVLVHERDRLEVFIYLDRQDADLERLVDARSLAIGCTPVVNLFTRACEPIRLDGRTTEYPIVPDSRRPQAFEVWSVEGVREQLSDGSQRGWLPFYRRRARGEQRVGGTYLTARREGVGPHGGSDVMLLPVDAELSAGRPSDVVLSVDALCTNRNLPVRLPFGGSDPVLHLVQGQAPVASVTCLMPFTAAGRPRLRAGRSRNLISHLSLGHLSLVDGEAAGGALREILQLYDTRDSEATRAAIDGLLAVHTRETTGRVPGARAGSFVSGLDLRLVFDPASWDSAGLFLLATVLDRFLALHATVNAFIRTRAMLEGRPDPVARFGARAGMRPIL